MKLKNKHRADIVATLHKRGTSLSQLARDNNLHDSTLRAALCSPRTPSNKIIAAYLGCSLHELWPIWFDSKNRLIAPKRSRIGRRPSSQKRIGKLTPTRRRA